MIVFAFQATMLEWLRSLLERRKAKRLQAIGACVPSVHRHPVLRWLAIFVVIEVVSLGVAFVVWIAVFK